LVQRAEGRAAGGHVVLVSAVEPGQRRYILVREHLLHARQGQHLVGVDFGDFALGDGAAHDVAVPQRAGHAELGRVLGRAAHLGRPLGAADRLAHNVAVEAHGGRGCD
nr:hypothetical protein [Tanacetum cinerariifolium]